MLYEVITIDAAVVKEFLDALAPAQVDALEGVMRKTTDHHREQVQHLERDVMRLEFEARRAERQYDNVDIPAATAKGIVVMNTPFGNSITTA